MLTACAGESLAKVNNRYKAVLPYTHHYFKKIIIGYSWQPPSFSMRELDEVFAALAKSVF